MISTLAYIVFFGVFSLNSFVPFKYADLILGVAAGVLAIVAFLGLR
jgi:hypothetical protein